MPDIAIQIENLSKQYRLGTIGSGTLSHDLQRWWAMNILGKEDPNLRIGETNVHHMRGESEFVWALRDINLEIEQGEVVGIIGKNGAGKSTLLKILSRVTKPSTGTLKYKGRLASLLEVGTGFHWEMTGRENIYMNGSIMGMTRHEITRKLDEIVAFAGVERYIDTPVKRYSSGMTVRLGFAVAAHLEPEILVVDEVLAVGDAEFQKKALGKMQDVSKKGGRTVLFVSHNMASINTLCQRAVLLANGSIAHIGSAAETTHLYLKGEKDFKNYRKFDEKHKREQFILHEISVSSDNRLPTEPVSENTVVRLDTQISFGANPDRFHLTYVIKDENGHSLFSFSHATKKLKLKEGLNHITCYFPKDFLNLGTYFLDLYIIEDSRRAIFVENEILSFEIIEGQREIGAWMGREPGFIKPVLDWKLT